MTSGDSGVCLLFCRRCRFWRTSSCLQTCLVASGSAVRQLSAEALPVLLSLEVTTLRGRGPMAAKSLFRLWSEPTLSSKSSSSYLLESLDGLTKLDSFLWRWRRGLARRGWRRPLR